MQYTKERSAQHIGYSFYIYFVNEWRIHVKCVRIFATKYMYITQDFYNLLDVYVYMYIIGLGNHKTVCLFWGGHSYRYFHIGIPLHNSQKTRRHEA